MNLVIFACEAKGLSSLNSIINEASERGINLFAMVCQDTQLRFPIQNKDRFEILTNCENTNPTYSQTVTNCMLDITDTTNQKVKFRIVNENSSTTVLGDSTYDSTFFRFTRLGDT